MTESEFLKTSFQADQLVYEVIRIIDGIALFLEDHFVRLMRSMQIQGLTFQMDFQDFQENIAELVRQNQRWKEILNLAVLLLTECSMGL